MFWPCGDRPKWREEERLDCQEFLIREQMRTERRANLAAVLVCLSALAAIAGVCWIL